MRPYSYLQLGLSVGQQSDCTFTLARWQNAKPAHHPGPPASPDHPAPEPEGMHGCRENVPESQTHNVAAKSAFELPVRTA